MAPFDILIWPHPLRVLIVRISRSESDPVSRDAYFLPPPAAGGGAVLTLRLRVFALALLQGTAEAVGLRSGLDDIRAVSDAVDQRQQDGNRPDQRSPVE